MGRHNGSRLEKTTRRLIAYNIGYGRGYSVREVIGAVEEIASAKVPLRVGPRRAGDPPVLCADPTKLKRDLGWEPLHDGISTIIESAWAWKSRQSRSPESPESERSQEHPIFQR